MLQRSPFSGPKSITSAPASVEVIERFESLPEADKVYANQLAQHTLLGTNYPLQEAAWAQEEVYAASSPSVRNQISQNVVFAGHAQFFPSNDIDLAWVAYMAWIRNEWSGFANSFLGYHGWWLNNQGNTQHPNANISGVL